MKTDEGDTRAVIADMDGVLTRTARVHRRVWAEMFDEFLADWSRRYTLRQDPFTAKDYLRYVDGKPRYDGVRDFLASREIELPEGEPSDGPDRETVCGLGNRKNELFVERIEHDGVEAFRDAVQALDYWRHMGVQVAAISASKNCRQVLRAADLLEYFETIVDGQDAEELGLSGKPELMKEAARRLSLQPERARVLEDALEGVRAARESGFGEVIGVDRVGQEKALTESGAHRVVHALTELLPERSLPQALEHLDELEQRRAGRPMAVFLDYDGTLTPIVDTPDQAVLSDCTRTVIKQLAERCTVAVVSGRDRKNVEERVQIDGLFYAGSHGFDIEGPGKSLAHPEAVQVLPELEQATRQLRERLEPISGAILEPKRFSIAAHYRMTDKRGAERVKRAVDDVWEETDGLRKRSGKKVLELQPDIDWDKGRAVEWLLDALDIDPSETLVMYIGDDETDEDAFRALGADGVGIRVGGEMARSAAQYRLDSPDQVRRFLDWLTGALG